LEFLVAKLEGRAQAEIGYNRDEALRCAKAVRAFQSTFQPKKFAKYDISAGGKTLIKSVSGIRLKVTLDAMVTETKEGMTSAGGITLLYAFSADWPDLKDRLSAMAGLVLWALEDGQMPTLPRLCIAVDIAETNVVKASANHQRFRERVEASCREVAAQWSDIEPPHDYDGPEWR
jgi:hypothetical protein